MLNMYKHEKLNFIMCEPANKECFDCKSPHPTYCSVTNGVTLCADCADKHMKLNPLISRVRSLYCDSWSNNEILFLEMSGNKRFASMMHEYQIPTDKTFDFKYSTIAAYYYRLLIHSQMTGAQPPVMPDSTAGQKLMTEDMLKEPGFFENVAESLNNFGNKVAQKTKEVGTAINNVFTGSTSGGH